MTDDEVKLIIDEYYKTIGIIRSARRHSYQVKARAAIMVALREDLSLNRIGRLFEMDHASVLHHERKHEANMKYWDGYAENFKIANGLVKAATKRLSYQARLAGVKAQIKYLEKMKETLIEKIPTL